MPTATKKAPVKRAKKAAEKGTLDYLELALENLKQAGEHAQKDARGQVDSAVERIREAVKEVTAELRKRAHRDA
jgi:hypothetical protein